MYLQQKEETNVPTYNLASSTHKNQSTGWTYIRPGQTDVPCVTFANTTVTGYNGVTMLTDVPANLLDWANNDGNVAYEGFTEDDTF
jgi:hypothetical protein